MESCFFGLTVKDLRILTHDLGEKNNIKQNFETSKKMTERSWLKKFLKRNQDQCFVNQNQHLRFITKIRFAFICGLFHLTSKEKRTKLGLLEMI